MMVRQPDSFEMPTSGDLQASTVGLLARVRGGVVRPASMLRDYELRRADSTAGWLRLSEHQARRSLCTNGGQLLKEFVIG